ncbi:TIGR00730 family Rossman fold protein [Hydrocarboniphaga sp.]|uniref:LOG family protein n=1 Tax=Hydrocarboniphaga sp. TaxID=2033016 RepID=UPI00262AA0EB|nr:TIGR00730 family Rossman fold protein [Hydrocarboniphaga sp.]
MFCGSSRGSDPLYAETARALGQVLAEAGIAVVYGGSSVGLMGELADAALAAGGKVIGVLPQALAHREIGHAGLTELRIVQSMHERKALMAELADGFIAMPGGIGTFEEIFEVWTWAQLGHHAKPCSLLNVDGFYDGLISFLDSVVDRQFIKPVNRDMLLIARDPATLLAKLRAYEAPQVTQWIQSDQS